jgi:hypothetical protein
MSSLMRDSDDFDLEPKEEDSATDSRAFTPDAPPLPHEKEVSDELVDPVPAGSGSVASQAAQAAYMAAQQATSVIPQLDKPRRVAWSAALAEDVSLMEALAGAASRTASRSEAMALAAPLPLLALRLAPHSYRALWPLLPALIHGTQGIVQFLYDRPSTRPLICLLPAILENSVAHLADCVVDSRPLSPLAVAKSLADHTRQMLQQQERQSAVRSRAAKRQRNGHGYRS